MIELGQSVTQLDVAQLQTLSASEFADCAYLLGRVINFTTAQWQALAGVAKQVRALVAYTNTSF